MRRRQACRTGTAQSAKAAGGLNYDEFEVNYSEAIAAMALAFRIGTGPVVAGVLAQKNAFPTCEATPSTSPAAARPTARPG